MEEGEALCSKLGIIVNGGMVCFGTNQNLKNRFMVGYILSVSCKEENHEQIITAVKDACGDAHITDKDAFRIKFSMSNSLSQIFEIGEDLVKTKGAVDFVVSQITLEDAFLTLTADQVAPEKIVDKEKPKNPCEQFCAQLMGAPAAPKPNAVEMVEVAAPSQAQPAPNAIPVPRAQ